MFIAMENSINPDNEASNQLVHTNNIASNLEAYFCNITALKLKIDV
ncbi:MAG: hypothetical protein O7C59_05985 [Rickettsia endosymbiont of Ixodes persulcatus]|nr:hypothetical protein [Rickettsia endosymbiont of Ixodes persulcatus]